MYYVYVAGYILLAAAMQLSVHRKLSCFFSRLSAEYHLCGDLAFPVMDTI